MDFESIHIPYGHADDHIQVWLHPTTSRTLVMLIHGHNATADQPRFVQLARTLQKANINVVRYNVVREKAGDLAQLVPTLDEEMQQARVVLHAFREEFDTIIVAGHSQGGIIALQLAIDEQLDGAVLLMSVMDTRASMERKLLQLGFTLDELQQRKHRTIDLPDGRVMLYTPAFFDDFELWDVHGMLAQWYGPTLFVAATADEHIPVDEIEHAESIANSPKEFFTVEDKHNFSPENAIVIAKRIEAWMQEQGLGSSEFE
jgi:pimeloyl-ACP methyl ester carboxylesterase